MKTGWHMLSFADQVSCPLCQVSAQQRQLEPHRYCLVSIVPCFNEFARHRADAVAKPGCLQQVLAQEAPDAPVTLDSTSRSYYCFACRDFHPTYHSTLTPVLS